MSDIPDTGQEWPFHFSKVPYRPVDEQEWREGVLQSLHRALPDGPGSHPSGRACSPGASRFDP